MNDARPARADYRWFRAFPLRLNDNDAYGHVNNTVYYQAMDTTVTSWLLREAGLRLDGEAMALVVASSCRYFASGVYPDDEFDVGLRADRVGTTSITWGLGIFRAGHAGAEGGLLAAGTFTHVFVGRDSGRPAPVPPALRERTARELQFESAPH